MIQVTNLTDDPFQEHVILFEESEIILDLRFYSTVEKWVFNVSFKDFSILGVKLAVNTLHMESSNMPFDFIVTDESGSGLDPFKLNDWEDERCNLFMLNALEMEEIRGVKVPI